MNMRKRMGMIIAIVIIAAGLGYVLWGGLEQNLVYFVTPTELLAKGPSAVGNPVRLGGVVANGTVRFSASGAPGAASTASGQYSANVLTFSLTDDHQQIVVVTTKTPPQMFREGMGVVVEGSLQADGRFNAERLMIKHGNEYRPPKAGEMPQEIYQELKKPAP